MSAPTKPVDKNADKGKASTPAPANGTPTPAALDWGSVSVAESDKPITRQAKNSVDLKSTPFPKLYDRSKVTGKAIDFGPLPTADAVKTAVRLIRETARAAGGGVKFRVDEKARVVSFQAADKKTFTPGKPRRPRKGNKENEGDYGKRLAEFTVKANEWNRAHPDDTVSLTPAKSGK